MKINLKKRFSNKAFCVAFAAAVILLLQQLGLGNFIPENTMDIVNTVLLILTMLGIIVDPTSEGVADSQLILNGGNSKDLIDEKDELNIRLEELEEEVKRASNKEIE